GTGRARARCGRRDDHAVARGLRPLRMSLRPTARFAFAHPAHAIALGFGTGLAPLGPGTVGAMLAFPIYIALDRWLDAQWLVGVAAVSCAVGVWAGGRAGRALGVPARGAMNGDEVVAMMLLLLVAPADWEWWIFASGAFRFFDIVNPPPIRDIDRSMK